MKKLFVPLAITALSVAGMELEPDADRLVNVSDDQVAELKGHGLIDPNDEAAMEAYMATLGEKTADGDDTPTAPRPAAKKVAVNSKPKVGGKK